ncbi:MAG: Hydrolase [uncultured Paraburkholderia sp.]|nr:MAG: Hydrolase [uncultured Paraburkholderia sp.]CAH2921754.1 MAG: Hydrolase [uncultured Paraburkholderia sp.]
MEEGMITSVEPGIYRPGKWGMRIENLVLIDWSPEYLYRELIPDESERRWFLANVCTMDWVIR